VRRRRTAQSLI